MCRDLIVDKIIFLVIDIFLSTTNKTLQKSSASLGNCYLLFTHEEGGGALSRRLGGLVGKALDRRSLPSEFESRRLT